jgi:DNA primase
MIEQFLDRLTKVKPLRKDKFVACCPAHDDKKQSMVISDEPEKIGIHCFAGCSGQAIEVIEKFEACCARKSAEIKLGFHDNHGR